MKRPSRRTLLLAPLLLTLAPRGAAAHAILLASIPTAGATIAMGQITFILRFNSRLDRARSRLVLHGPDGVQTVLTINPAGPEDTLSARAIVTPGGQTLRWQALALDGHITRGQITFIVTGR
jgi:copper resistance protein C